MAFLNISEQQENDLLAGVVAGDYSLLLGAGASYDSTNARGNLPLGDDLKSELSAATGLPNKYNLQRLFSALEPSEVDSLITQRMSGVTPGETMKVASGYNWKRIFTFNVDDSVNAAFGGSQRQAAKFIHFSDPYADFQTNADLPIIFLHGSVLEPEKGYVFSRDQYIRMMRGQNHWMILLSGVMRNDPLIISGASMDEVDLEYYLSFRSELTSRDDVAPSIFVDGTVDRLSEAFCREHNLIQFVGYSSDFFSYLKSKIPHPPLVEDRIAAGVREILPGGVGKVAAIQFDADFELVPKLQAETVSSNKFYRGHPPAWSDLAAQLDVPRRETLDLNSEFSSTDGNGREIIILTGPTGTGKTTTLRRLAYNLAASGKYHILWASELGRLSRTTASTLDLIDDKVIIFVDNIADHAQSINDVLSLAERDDLIFIGAERSYRKEYLDKTFGAGGYRQVSTHIMRPVDIERLIEKLSDRALIGTPDALSSKSKFIKILRRDPIAVATCRIINDFRPLDRIVSGLLGASGADEVFSFCIVALAEHCNKSGLRHEILGGIVDEGVIRKMLTSSVPLTLRHVSGNRQFLVTENSTISDEVLMKLSDERSSIVFDAFCALGEGLAPFVNRNTIRSRSPEARLAGRLFDFDDIVEKFLGGRSEEFYEATKDAWRWNSRYWEQASLLMLAKSLRAPSDTEAIEFLEESLQRARYSVAVEEHPFGLTTLARVLMTFVGRSSPPNAAAFSEAFDALKKAIEFEKRFHRISQHPYSTLIFGSTAYLENGGSFSPADRHEIRELVSYAMRRWKYDRDLLDQADRLLRMSGM